MTRVNMIQAEINEIINNVNVNININNVITLFNFKPIVK